jgi:hypothetical protein
MRKVMMATLGAALLVLTSAVQASGTKNVGIDPSVTSAKRIQDNSRGLTQPRDSTVRTQPVQKPAGAGGSSRTPQR